ncbi:transporter substrate-binding domain-containing protein [Leeia sp. TBRC 13508]|uniref:Transporter substrate-binding domain-containing protein n=1 Tax=Leeia speluncae TaxID=2884804 RepID=A0ABS8D9F5_9NEIS|nr:transporter substrate-binding domain-containing protein [Leeia speluncae]MCB6184571.1 transporter substrate-binding domain-containing protein [Leeia speluncae]
MKTLSLLLAGFICCLPILEAYAAPRVLLPAIRPFAYEENGEVKGFDADLLEAINKQLGLKLKGEVVPLPRILLYMDTTPEIVTFIARTPEREKLGIWLNKVFEQPYVLISLTTTTKRPKNLADAKNFSVGVAKGSIGEQIATKAELKQIDVSQDEVTNAKKLIAGRIDVWLATNLAAMNALKTLSLTRESVYMSYPVAQYETWMAVTKDWTPQQRQQWQKALNELTDSGELQRLKTKWGLIW